MSSGVWSSSGRTNRPPAIAEATGRDKGHLSRVERGEREITPAALLRDYESVLGRIVAATAGAGPAKTRADPVTVDDMNRREALGTIAAASWTATSTGFLASITTQSRRLGSTDAARIQQSAARLYRLDYQHGGTSLWQAAIMEAQAGLTLLEQGTYTDKIGKLILRSTSRMQMCAGTLLGDLQSCDNAIKRARLMLDRDGTKPTAEWLSFVTPAELDGVEATCMAKRGRAQRGESLLKQAIARHNGRYPRNRALYEVRLADVQIGRGSIEGAAEAANAALDLQPFPDAPVYEAMLLDLK